MLNEIESIDNIKKFIDKAKDKEREELKELMREVLNGNN